VNFLVETLLIAGRLGEAAHIIERNPCPKPRYLNILGVHQAREGRLDRAEISFREALSASPHDPKILNNLGNLALLERKPDVAKEFYEKALQGNVFMIEPRYNLVIAYQDLGLSEKALAAYEEYRFLLKLASWFRVILVTAVGFAMLFFLYR